MLCVSNGYMQNWIQWQCKDLSGIVDDGAIIILQFYVIQNNGYI